jgi:hypothetical protein
LHAGKIVRNVFDRRGIDIVSAADDKVLGAAGQDQPFILGQIADIAGHEPTGLCQHADIMSRIDVAREHLRTLNKD